MILEKPQLDVRTLEPAPVSQTLVKDRPPPYALPATASLDAMSMITATTSTAVESTAASSGWTLPQPGTPREPIPSPASSTSTLQRPAQQRSTSGSSVLNPIAPQHVNRFALNSKLDPISGYFVIDTSLERSDKLIRARSPLHSPNKKFFHKKPIPHATFSTNKSAISLRLGSTQATIEARRSYIQARSRSGTVRATISPLPGAMNNVCLEVLTKDGNIIVFIPPNFSGGIQFRSKRVRNALNFLPEFATRARIINGSDKDSFVLFGTHDLSLSDLKNTERDLLLLSTQSGMITVGVTGLDYYEEPKLPIGFWKKFLGGKSASTTDEEATQ